MVGTNLRSIGMRLSFLSRRMLEHWRLRFGRRAQRKVRLGYFFLLKFNAFKQLDIDWVAAHLFCILMPYLSLFSVPYSDRIFKEDRSSFGEKENTPGSTDPEKSAEHSSRDEFLGDEVVPASKTQLSLFSDSNTTVSICGLSPAGAPSPRASNVKAAKTFLVGNAFVEAANARQMSQLYKIVTPNQNLASMLANGKAELVKTNVNGLLTTQVREVGGKAIGTANLAPATSAATAAVSLLSAALNVAAMMALANQISSMTAAIEEIRQRQIAHNRISLSSKMESAVRMCQDAAYDLSRASAASGLSQSSSESIKNRLFKIRETLYKVKPKCEGWIEEENRYLVAARGADSASEVLQRLDDLAGILVCTLRMQIFVSYLEMNLSKQCSEPIDDYKLRQGIQDLQKSDEIIQSIQESFWECRKQSKSGVIGTSLAWMRSDRAKFPEVVERCQTSTESHRMDLFKARAWATRLMQSEDGTVKFQESDFANVYVQVEPADDLDSNSSSSSSSSRAPMIDDAPQLLPVRVSILEYEPAANASPAFARMPY
jgi:hypothetical protein